MQRRRLKFLVAVSSVAATVVCSAISPATGAIILDQEMAQAGGTVSNDSTLQWQQSFKQVNNNITHASVNLPFDPGTVTLQVLDALCGNVMASGTASGSGWVQVDFGGPVVLVPEQTYYLQAFSTQVMGMSGSNPPYARGLLHWRSTSTQLCEPFVIDYDLMFRTYADDEFGPTPVRATTWSGVKTLYR